MRDGAKRRRLCREETASRGRTKRSPGLPKLIQRAQNLLFTQNLNRLGDNFLLWVSRRRVKQGIKRLTQQRFSLRVTDDTHGVYTGVSESKQQQIALVWLRAATVDYCAGAYIRGTESER